MRRVLLIAMMIGMGVTASASLDQNTTHLNATEPAVKSELKIPTDVVLSNCMLKAGVYTITCDREMVTFVLKSTGEVAVSLPCQGAVLKDKIKETSAIYEKQPSGYIVLDKLYLKGSNIEHVF